MKEGVDAKSLSFWRFFYSNSRYWIAPVIGVAILMIGLIMGRLLNSDSTDILINLGLQFTIWGIIFSIWYSVLDYRRAMLNKELQKKP